MTHKRDRIHTNTNKYTVKNCPMYFCGNCYGHTGNCDCSDCTSCVMKQIVNKCKAYRNMQAITTEDYARREVALKILDLLDI